jgi:hypothetical protein
MSETNKTGPLTGPDLSDAISTKPQPHRPDFSGLPSKASEKGTADPKSEPFSTTSSLRDVDGLDAFKGWSIGELESIAASFEDET